MNWPLWWMSSANSFRPLRGITVGAFEHFADMFLRGAIGKSPGILRGDATGDGLDAGFAVRAVEKWQRLAFLCAVIVAHAVKI
jgi:hypothetical protein